MRTMPWSVPSISALSPFGPLPGRALSPPTLPRTPARAWWDVPTRRRPSRAERRPKPGGGGDEASGHGAAPRGQGTRVRVARSGGERPRVAQAAAHVRLRSRIERVEVCSERQIAAEGALRRVGPGAAGRVGGSRRCSRSCLRGAASEAPGLCGRRVEQLGASASWGRATGREANERRPGNEQRREEPGGVVCGDDDQSERAARDGRDLSGGEPLVEAEEENEGEVRRRPWALFFSRSEFRRLFRSLL